MISVHILWDDGHTWQEAFVFGINNSKLYYNDQY